MCEGSSVEEGNDEWTAAAWISSMENLNEAVAAELFKPLGANATGEQQLAYIRTIGRSDGRRGQSHGRDALLQLLRDSKVLEVLADELWEGATELASAAATTATELRNKFVQDDEAFTISYGGVDTFFGGLERLIGPPSPQLLETMTHEHTRSADSQVIFKTSNYGVSTTSEIEWYFVNDPEDGLSTLGIKSWPAEMVEQCQMRKPMRLSSFEAKRSQIDTALEAIDQFPMRKEELIGARCYTGPMFVKYNVCLRGVGVKAMEKQMVELCHGNRYVTTIHVINSAVVKLGKLTPAGKVYRGISGGILPENFLKSDVDGVRGGCEYGFLSTTTDREVAFSYAHGGRTGVIFEIQMGLIDRGADLSWISQYPTEEEILFAPLTGIEIVNTRVQGATLVVEVRLSVNMMNRTIEEVVAKMQTSALGLCELISDDFRFSGVPEKALEGMRILGDSIEAQQPSYFNSSENYKTSVQQVLDSKKAVIKSLPNLWDSPADSSEGGRLSSAEGRAAAKQQQHTLAALAARESEHQVAAQLLHLFLNGYEFTEEDHSAIEEAMDYAAAFAGAAGDSARDWEPSDTSELDETTQQNSWRLEATQALVREGCLYPWPGTAVELARGGGPLIGRACCHLIASKLAKRRAVGVAVVVRYKIRSGRVVWGKGIILEEHATDPPSFDLRVGTIVLKKIGEAQIVLPEDGGGGAVLRAAAAAGHASVVKALLECKASVASVDQRGSTALHEAAAGGHAAVCRVLVDAGADPNSSNTQQTTPWELSVLSRESHVKIDRIFRPLESDRELQDLDSNHLSPLLRAAADGEIEAIDAAVAAASDGGGEAAVAELLEERAPCSHTCLMLAVRGEAKRDGAFEDATATKRLLALKADVNALSDHGVSALAIATEEGDGRLAELLLLANATVDKTTQGGFTPLMQASRFGFVDLVTLLLGADANPGLAAADGSTALHLAAENGRVEALAKLIECLVLREGPKALDAKDGNGNTALAMASGAGHADGIKLLLAAKAQTNIKNQEGYTALRLAIADNHEETARVLISEDISQVTEKHEGDGSTLLHTACMYGHLETALLVIQKGVEVNEVTKPSQRTALMTLCFYENPGDDDLMMLLLQARADHSATTPSGESALHIAAEHGHTLGVRTLLRRGGAAPDSTRADGCTPLMLAVQNDYEAVLALLLDHNASPDIAKPDGATALLLASEQGYANSCKLLLEAGANPALKMRSGKLSGKNALQLAQTSGQEAAFTMLETFVEKQKLQQDKNKHKHKHKRGKRRQSTGCVPEHLERQDAI